MRSKLVILAALMGTQSVFAGVNGDVSNFKSPRGITESCIAITKLPMGKYSSKDVEKEKEFCSLNFYDNSVALCPKTWSTSPGTIIHDNKATGKSSEVSEGTLCGKSSPLDSIAKFKTTMNQSGTSGTYSWSSILYYHFSRALDATIDIPVAVYRTIDKDAHYARVASKANPAANAKMNATAWQFMRAGEKNPSSLKPTADMFTPDMEQIYGVLLKDKGERYGAEVNGTRASGWGKGQNFDMQKTPSFLALKSSKPMQEAMEEGITQAFKDPAMAKAFASVRPSKTQMALWMKEMTEMVILDYIFSQQDRVGNIDYRWFWVYQDPSGKVNLTKADSEVALTKKNSIKVPAEIATMNPILIQKTSIGDNDAGGLANYANFTKSTGMLEGIRHINPETYRRLYNMALDFEQQGPNYQVLANSFGLRADSMKQTIANTKLAATILLKACEAGQLRFDLVSYKAAYQNQFSEAPVNCRP